MTGANDQDITISHGKDTLSHPGAVNHGLFSFPWAVYHVETKVGQKLDYNLCDVASKMKVVRFAGWAVALF